MTYNDGNGSLSAGAPFFYDSASSGDVPKPHDRFYFPSRPLSAEQQAGGPAETPFPYPYTSETAASFTENSFEWYDPMTSGGSRMPDQPVQTGGGSRLERRLISLERRQDRLERELERMDRRVRLLERRIGLPIPPGGIPR
ncbi:MULTISPECIES: hypothetical protein [unclassified Sporolactobacillus]|uniref:hypothetical protein n=1 Tax=unclassified Sporolactobacillus TaxID=2628533 RepID=UPI002367CFF4|nr:hypothetical protein [Sporolactobacillus sp. CQH2019]MDD9149478.1 hypothetical protein [Sporolactobacillus sp. CQH2019]